MPPRRHCWPSCDPSTLGHTSNESLPPRHLWCETRWIHSTALKLHNGCVCHDVLLRLSKRKFCLPKEDFQIPQTPWQPTPLLLYLWLPNSYHSLKTDLLKALPSAFLCLWFPPLLNTFLSFLCHWSQLHFGSLAFSRSRVISLYLPQSLCCPKWTLCSTLFLPVIFLPDFPTRYHYSPSHLS